MARKPAPEGADRRQLILEAALDVFAEQGFEGATTKEIAARAGVTHGLIYFYFSSKEDLFQAVFEHTLSGALGGLADAATPGVDDDPDVVIENTLAQALELLTSPRASSLARMMLRMVANGDRKEGPLRECKYSMIRAIGQFSDSLVAYLDGQITRGRLRPVDTRAVVRLLIGGLVAGSRVEGSDPTIDERTRMDRARALARTYTDVLLRGLLPRAPSLNEEDAPSRGAVAIRLDP